MQIDIEIGPYTLFKRTEYSKLRILDENNENILDTDIGQKIIEDYDKQSKNPKKYFNIKGQELLNVLDGITEDNIKYLFVPYGVDTLNGKFAYSYNIEFISLPDTLHTIDREAFAGCKNLKYIKIPDSVKNLYGDCFKWCESLETVVFPDLKKISEGMFDGCRNLCNVILPESLEIIEKTCFLNCSSMKKVVIPNSVRSIGRSAFLGCRALESVKLPKDLKIIDIGTFCDCNNLDEINIPNTVYEIGREAFSGVMHLEEMTIPRDLKNVGWRPFFNSSVKTLIFNHDLKRISGSDAYGNPTNLIAYSKIEKFVISKNVKKITSAAVGVDGNKIKKINYLGTKEEFEEFKENNKSLFSLLTNLKEVNFFENEVKRNAIEKQIR